MEVHHHPHVGKKNFKEYLLEGFMIFIAVFMGFVAENIREHFAERKISRQYLESFELELHTNEKLFSNFREILSSRMPALDSLVDNFIQKKENTDLANTVRLTSFVRKVFIATVDKSAYEQLVNSGGLKYIDNGILKDSLSIYQSLVDNFERYNSYIDNYRASAFHEVSALEDLHSIFNPGAPPMPYPDLTERERHIIINYYSTQLARYKANLNMLDMLEIRNKHLLEIIDEELEK